MKSTYKNITGNCDGSLLQIFGQITILVHVYSATTKDFFWLKSVCANYMSDINKIKGQILWMDVGSELVGTVEEGRTS